MPTYKIDSEAVRYLHIKILCALPRFIVTFGNVLAYFCQLDINLHIFGERESQETEELPPSEICIYLWICLRSIFLINDKCVRAQSIVGSAIPGPGLYKNKKTKKQAEQATESKPVSSS